MRILTALSALALACCVATPPITTDLHTLSSAERTAVQQGVRGSLKDPNSAIFGNMMASKDTNNVVYVCGIVNARNSFGGYVGDQPYVGVLTMHNAAEPFHMASIGGTDINTTVTMNMCRHYGIV